MLRSSTEDTYSSRPTISGEDLFTTFADRVVLRVQDVMAGRNCAAPPSLDEKNLLHQLQSRVGLARAIPAGQLCERLRVSPRKLKELVHDLRLNFAVQIGASRDASEGGYYLISNDEESLDSSTPMLHQAIAMLRVVHVLRAGHTVAELLGQVRLQLEDPARLQLESEVADGR